MGKVIVLQHVANEGLGIIEPILAKRDLIPQFVKLYEGDEVPESIDRVAALIILGGPMSVNDVENHPYIKDEIRLIQDAFRFGTSILGICLGAQLIAKAAGATVYKGKEKEIGWYDISLTPSGKRDPLFGSMPDTLKVFQWHGETFDMPVGATRLATSDLFPNQLLRVVGHAYAMQFHLEVDEPMIRSFIEAGAEELAELKGAIDPDAILNDIPKYIEELNEHGRRFLDAFFSLVE